MKSRHLRFVVLLTAALLSAPLAWVWKVSSGPEATKTAPSAATSKPRLSQIGFPDLPQQHRAEPQPKAVEARTDAKEVPSRLLFGSAWGHEPKPELQAFDDWTSRYLAAAAADRERLEPEGQALLGARMQVLKDLIKSDPRQAIASTVPMAVRYQLPDDITAQLEARVGGAGRIDLLGAMAPPGGTVPQATFRAAMINDQEYDAYVYGRREQQATKVDVSIAGVAVGKALAVSESPVRVLDPGEVPPAKAEIYPVCPVSGDTTPTTRSAPQNTAVSNVVEVGGKIYHLCHLVHVAAFEQQLINAENAAGPYSGSLSNEIVAADGQPGTSSVSGRPPVDWSTGVKKVIVIRVDFSDKAGTPAYPYSPFSTIDPAYVVNVFSQANGISDYYSQASYGQTSLTINASDVTPVYRMPKTAATYAVNGDNDTLHSDARAAATAGGYNLDNYDRIGVVFADLGSISHSQITYGGLGDIQGDHFWINGFFDFRDCSHEIGHNYGLQHCNLWQVSDGNPVSDTGSSTEYGDPFGVMGDSSSDIRYHFDMWEKSILHWIPDGSVTTVATSGTYRVYRFDHANANTANPLALKVVRNGVQDYWIGLRQLFTANSSLMNGAYVLWGYNSVVQGNLLDMTTPGTNSQDAALAVGASFHDTAAGITLHPLTKGGTTPNEYLDVQVTIDPRIQWQPSTYTVDKQLGVANLTLVRGSSSAGAVSVNYATAPGTATAPAYYTTKSGTITWADGDSSPKTVSISLVPTASFTGLASFTVNLSNATGGVIINNTAATVNIASSGTSDPGFHADFVDNDVLQHVVQPDGKVLVAGWMGLMQDSSFTEYTRNGFGRLNVDGSVDTSFGNGVGVDEAPVYAMVLQPDGGILIGGAFSNVHGTVRNHVARLNSDGSLDTSFDPGAGPSDVVRSIALQPDGKIIIGGDFTTVAAVPHRYVARLNSDGTVDSTFGSPTFASGSWEVHALTLQPDGKVLMGGLFYFSASVFPDGKNHSGLVRLTSIGTVDTSFNTGSGAFGAGNLLEWVRTICLQQDGSVIAGGDFTTFNSVSHSRLVRLASTGTTDASFSPTTDDTVYTSLIQADGKIVVGGDFTHLDSTARSRFGRINANGSLDSTFDPGTGSSGTVYDITMQADGKLVLSGSYATIEGVTDITVARVICGQSALPGTVQFSAATTTGTENSSVTVTATRTGGSLGAVSMNYGTQGGTAAASRYTPVGGILSWADGDTAGKTFQVPLINDGIAQPDQTFSLNLGIPVGGVIAGTPGNIVLTISTPVNLPPYQQWQSSKFTSLELQDSTISGDLADPDHDGLPNLLEYAFGLEPKTANPTGRPVASVQTIGGLDYLTLTVRQSTTASDLTYTPQCGPAMGTWSSATAQVGTPVDNGDGTQTVTYRDNLATSQATRRFMRLQVTRSP